MAVVNDKKQTLENFARVMTHELHKQKVHVETMSQTLVERMNRWVATLATRVDASHRLLGNLDPARVLSRGYAIATAGGRVVKDASSLELGAELTVQFAKGVAETTVKRKR